MQPEVERNEEASSPSKPGAKNHFKASCGLELRTFQNRLIYHQDVLLEASFISVWLVMRDFALHPKTTISAQQSVGRLSID